MWTIINNNWVIPSLVWAFELSKPSAEMTSKKSTGKLEIDVQKLRDEGNWKKLIELTEGGKIGINGKLLFC